MFLFLFLLWFPLQKVLHLLNTSAPIFEAKFTNENPSDIFVQTKTAFIDLKNGRLSIKEPDGELKEYGLVLPKDEKDIKIENLENKIREMEMKLNEPKQSNQPIIEQPKSYEYDNGYTPKSKSKNGFFKPSEQ